jgi:hypothetical protein
MMLMVVPTLRMLRAAGHIHTCGFSLASEARPLAVQEIGISHLHIPTVDYLYAPPLKDLHRGVQYISGMLTFSSPSATAQCPHHVCTVHLCLLFLPWLCKSA